MKNKKKVLLISLLAVFIVAAAGITFARYQSKGVGEDTFKVAKWAVKVNTVDITPAAITPFTTDITWTNADNVVEGYIAPGMTGTASIVINPEGSQVAMNYWLDVETDLTGNDNISIKSVKVGDIDLPKVEAVGDPHEGMYAGTIALPTTGAMTATETQTAVVTLEWEDKNTDDANAADTATGVAADGLDKTLTVNVIVEQKVD